MVFITWWVFINACATNACNAEMIVFHLITILIFVNYYRHAPRGSHFFVFFSWNFETTSLFYVKSTFFKSKKRPKESSGCVVKVYYKWDETTIFMYLSLSRFLHVHFNISYMNVYLLDVLPLKTKFLLS